MSSKCTFRKTDGSRCGANAQPANGFCVFHDPERATDGKRARRAGGLNRSRPATVLPADTPDYPLGNTNDVSAFLGDSINRLRRGELDPKVANAIGYLASVLLRALEQGPIEERLAHLEAALGANRVGSEVFAFRPRKEVAHEQSSAAPEGN
jgi:hypothetical protein